MQKLVEIINYFFVSKMIGYKAGFSDKKRVIITLEIPEDALTNINRTNIVDKSKAKYRTNKAVVIKIEDKEGNTYEFAESGFYKAKKVDYLIHETVKELNYDTTINNVCAPGIHFFLEKRSAYLYGRDLLENGLFQKWHANGQLWIEGNYINWKRDGYFQEWDENGTLCIKANYSNGHIKWTESEF